MAPGSACLSLPALHPRVRGGCGGRPGILAAKAAPGLPALPLAGFGQREALRVSLGPFPTPAHKCQLPVPCRAPLLRALGVSSLHPPPQPLPRLVQDAPLAFLCSPRGVSHLRPAGPPPHPRLHPLGCKPRDRVISPPLRPDFAPWTQMCQWDRG